VSTVHLVHNERTKLTASWGNTVAAAFIAAGAVAPVAGILYGLTALPITPGRMLALAFTCLAFGIGIHVMARISLRSLRE
jgi:hypothetical protein